MTVRLPNELWIAIFRINARLDAALNHALGRLRVQKGHLSITLYGSETEIRERYYHCSNGKHAWGITIEVRHQQHDGTETAITCTERWYGYCTPARVLDEDAWEYPE